MASFLSNASQMRPSRVLVRGTTRQKRPVATEVKMVCVEGRQR